MKMQVVPTAPPSPVIPIIGDSEQMLTGRRRPGRGGKRSARLSVSASLTPEPPVRGGGPSPRGAFSRCRAGRGSSC